MLNDRQNISFYATLKISREQRRSRWSCLLTSSLQKVAVNKALSTEIAAVQYHLHMTVHSRRLLSHLLLTSHLNDDTSIYASDQPNLTRNDRPRLHRRSMMPGQVPINRHILVQVWQHLLRAWRITPITHQIAHNGKQTVHLDTSACHLIVGSVAHELRCCAGRFNVGEDGVPGCA